MRDGREKIAPGPIRQVNTARVMRPRLRARQAGVPKPPPAGGKVRGYSSLEASSSSSASIADGSGGGQVPLLWPVRELPVSLSS